MITLQQMEIPIIETTEKDSITLWANLDSAKVYYEKALLLDPKNAPANNNFKNLLFFIHCLLDGLV